MDKMKRLVRQHRSQHRNGQPHLHTEAVADRSVEAAKQDVNEAEAKVEAAKLDVNAAKQDLNTAEAKLDKAEDKLDAAQQEVHRSRLAVQQCSHEQKSKHEQLLNEELLNAAQFKLQRASDSYEHAKISLTIARSRLMTAQKHHDGAVQHLINIRASVGGGAGKASVGGGAGKDLPDMSTLTLAPSLAPSEKYFTEQHWTQLKARKCTCPWDKCCALQNSTVDLSDEPGMKLVNELCHDRFDAEYKSMSNETWEQQLKASDEFVNFYSTRLNELAFSNDAVWDPAAVRVACASMRGMRQPGSFDAEEDWLLSSLIQWSFLGEKLLTQSPILEVTYDMNFMVFFNFLAHRISGLPMLHLREKKSQTSRRPTVKRVDGVIVAIDGAEVLFFESSLCAKKSNRLSHSQGDFDKLVKLQLCAYKHDHDRYGFNPHCTPIALHLEQVGQNIQLRATALRLNTAHRTYELHGLFCDTLPVAFSCKLQLDQVWVTLKNMHALVHFANRQEKSRLQTRGEYMTRVPAGRRPKGSKEESEINDSSIGDTSYTAPQVNVQETPAKLGGPRSLRCTMGDEYDLVPGLVAFGAFAEVRFAVQTRTAQHVALKIQRRRPYLLELHALQRLRCVSSVVQLLDFWKCHEGYVLVLPRLYDVDYDAMKQTPGALVRFASVAGAAVQSIHQLGFAHGDIKPSAFMKGTDDTLVLVDFNCCASADAVVGHRVGETPLSGTPGFVFDDTPARVRSDGDKVGLAAVVGWVLDVRGFGEEDTTFAWAVSAVKETLSAVDHKTDQIDIVVGLLQLVFDLLSLRQVEPSIAALKSIGRGDCVAPTKDNDENDCMRGDRHTESLIGALPLQLLVGHENHSSIARRPKKPFPGSTAVTPRVTANEGQRNANKGQ